MTEYVEAARLEQVLRGKGWAVMIADKGVALFNVDGTIYAIEDAGLRRGRSLGTIELEGKVVTCRGNGLKYDVTTGNALDASGLGLSTYSVKIEDGKIMVAI